MKDDLLRDAIADAKAVRETAVANAKMAIEEAFAPKIQSMINNAVQNEDDTVEEPVVVPEITSEVEPVIVPEMGSPEGEAPIEPEIDALAGAPDDSLETGIEVPPEAPEEPYMETNDQFSLESIIKELEQEAATADAGDVNTFNEQEGQTDETEVDEQAETTGFAKGDNKKPSPKSSSNAGVEDPQGGIKPNHPKATTSDKDLKENEEKTEENVENTDEDINLEELIKELKEEYSSEDEDDKDKEDMDEVKKSLQEHREVIKFLRSKLHEVNLLNAKLLFTNKIIKKHSLNEDQKLKVVETLDRAISVKECKLVYSTLEEAFSGMKPTSNRAKRVVESLASTVVASTKPSKDTQKTILNEGADLAARFKKLAGIKNKK